MAITVGRFNTLYNQSIALSVSHCQRTGLLFGGKKKKKRRCISFWLHKLETVNCSRVVTHPEMDTVTPGALTMLVISLRYRIKKSANMDNY